MFFLLLEEYDYFIIFRGIIIIIIIIFSLQRGSQILPSMDLSPVYSLQQY